MPFLRGPRRFQSLPLEEHAFSLCVCALCVLCASSVSAEQLLGKLTKRHSQYLLGPADKRFVKINRVRRYSMC